MNIKMKQVNRVEMRVMDKEKRSASKLAVVLTMLASFLLASTAHAAQTVTYYHADALGSTVATSDESGMLLWRKSYDPYGEKLSDGEGVNNSVSYTGDKHDDTTGLTYMGARYYDPQVGRFMGMDPVGFQDRNPASFNRYSYANNNPYKYVDPDGEAVILATIAIVGLAWSAYDAYQTASDLYNGDISASEAAISIGTDAAIGLVSGGLGKLAIKALKKVDEGVIYRVDGSKTESGKPYIGSANDLEKRAKNANDGRDRTDAEEVGKFPIGDKNARRKAEQIAINENGGVANLDNKRNEIAPSKWKDHGIDD